MYSFDMATSVAMLEEKIQKSTSLRKSSHYLRARIVLQEASVDPVNLVL